MVGTSGLRFASVLGWLWVPAQQLSQGALEHGLLAESTLESDPPLFLLGPESCVRAVGVHKLSLLIWVDLVSKRSNQESSFLQILLDLEQKVF